MTIWLTSDLHLGHEKVAGLRGFADTRTHDQAIMRLLRRRVKDADTLWVLGDIAMGSGWVRALRLLGDLPGVKHLVCGNHDRAHSLQRGHIATHQQTAMGVFASVTTAAALRHNGQTWLLSHFPYDGDSGDDERFPQWRLRDMGAPLFHGHTHSGAAFTLSAAGSPQVHVGVDAWQLGPVTVHDAAKAANL